MRIGTLFSGIGSPEQGAKRVYGDDLKMVFACEYDDFARQSFLANYDIDEAHFHKDIYDMDGTQYQGKCDILIGGSPCQAFSIAGLRKGLNDKRGELIYEYIRLVNEVKAPLIVYENVKGMISIENGKTIKEFVQALRDIGYHCHYSVLNSKDYGVPQNRERLFLVGFLDVELYHSFNFAPKKKLVKRLRDILESKVEEKYYLSNKMIEYISTKSHLHQSANQMQNGNECRTLNATDYKCPPCVKVEAILSDVNYELAARIYDKDGISPTIRTFQGGGLEPKVLEDRTDNYRIRKLTPRECLRIQDFPDTFKQVVSNSQMYKQAGNSMTVAVLEMIFNQIEKAKRKEITTLF